MEKDSRGALYQGVDDNIFPVSVFSWAFIKYSENASDLSK